jgi:hypothetical protein
MRRALFVLATVVLAGPAQARSLERLAVSEFRGPQAGRIQGAVESGLMSRYYVVPDFSVERAARKHGVELAEDSDFGVVGRTLELTGFVSARVQKRGTWRVRLLVRRGDTGAPAGVVVLADRRLDRLEAQVAREAPARVQRLLARAAQQRPAPEPAPAPEPTVALAPVPAVVSGPAALQPPPADPSALTVAAQAPAPASSWRTPAFELSMDGRVFTRSFSYVQNLTGLPDYRLPPSFSTALDLSLYPGAWLSRRLAPIGLTGAVEYAPSIRTRSAGSDPLTTSVHGYRLGVKYRLAWPTLSLAPQLAQSEEVFQTGAARAPDVRYRLVFAGVDGRWEPGPRLSVSTRLAYLHALSAGPLGAANAFPHLTAQGVLAEAVLALEVAPAVELRLTMGLRQMGLAMHARPGERWIAGGATDQVAWLGLGVAYRPQVAR